MTANPKWADPADDALTDLGGILHALDIIRRENAFNKPGPEFYALNVLIPLALQKTEALQQAIRPCSCQRRASQ